MNRIENNKAVIKIYDNNVCKKYYRSEKNQEDFKAIQQIWSVFKTPENYNSWKYTFIEVIDTSEKDGILMKRMPSMPMQEDQKFGKDNYFHAGLWLGYFHKQSREETKKDWQVHAAYDYTVANIFISRKEKVNTAFDPRSNVLDNKLESPYLDLITFFTSVIVSRFKWKKRYDKKCIQQFIKGYNTHSSFIYKPSYFKKTVDNKIEKIKSNKHKIKRNVKLKLIAGNFLLSFYLKHHLRPTLKRLDGIS